MNLKLLVKRLEEYASLKLAYAGWPNDNVGLLVEPSGELYVKKVLITNDLTEAVFAEAVQESVNMIIAYHPVIFKPLKRLTQAEWKQRSIIKCIENRIAVFCPHTSWDSVNNGTNDWILEAFDTSKVDSANQILDETNPCGFDKLIKIILPTELSNADYFSKLKKLDEIRLISQNENLADETTEFEYVTNPKGLKLFENLLFDKFYSITDIMKVVPTFIELIKSHFEVSVLNTLRILSLDKPVLYRSGLGRIGYLKEKIKISQVVEKMKSHLKMKTFRLALANGKTQDDYVSIIAVGAGCCSKILNNVNADIIITGEFSHHEILDENSRGVSVIVTDHSNTERGYIEVFKERFIDLLKKNNESVKMIVSKMDRDPLQYV